jgi:hypothetical protein
MTSPHFFRLAEHETNDIADRVKCTASGVAPLNCPLATWLNINGLLRNVETLWRSAPIAIPS